MQKKRSTPRNKVNKRARDEKVRGNGGQNKGVKYDISSRHRGTHTHTHTHTH